MSYVQNKHNIAKVFKLFHIFPLKHNKIRLFNSLIDDDSEIKFKEYVFFLRSEHL